MFIFFHSHYSFYFAKMLNITLIETKMEIVWIIKCCSCLLIKQMIGLACDIHDSHRMKKESSGGGEEDTELKELTLKHTQIDPSIKDIICFSFCYIGNLTGKTQHIQIIISYINKYRATQKNELIKTSITPTDLYQSTSYLLT